MDNLEFSHYRVRTASNVYMSGNELLIADEDTREFTCHETITTSAGTYQQWSGTEADIDEYIGVPVVSNFISSTAANEIATYNITAHNANLDTGHTVIGVIHAGVARRTATGGLDLRFKIRKGGVDYSSATKTLTSAWKYAYHIWDNDPSTGSPWANQSAVEAIEAGVESI